MNTVPRETARRLLFLVKYLHGCYDCGTHEGTLEFDHVNPHTKAFELGSEVAGRTWTEIWSEAQKCVVRCRSCHSKRTRAMA